MFPDIISRTNKCVRQYSNLLISADTSCLDAGYLDTGTWILDTWILVAWILVTWTRVIWILELVDSTLACQLLGWVSRCMLYRVSC